MGEIFNWCYFFINMLLNVRQRKFWPDSCLLLHTQIVLFTSLLLPYFRKSSTIKSFDSSCPAMGMEVMETMEYGG